MSGARDAILTRIRAATSGTPPAVERGPDAVARPGDPAVFRARVEDYRARVTLVAANDEIALAVAAILARHGAGRVVVPPGLPPAWRPAGVELVADDPPLAHAALAACDASLTASTLGIAETGTLLLSGAASEGRRALSLLPDVHVCVVRAQAIVADVASAIASIGRPAAPITLISGPSATSDIELERVEGVHGPRRLEVVLVDQGGG